MKKTFKTLGIIAIIAVIGFSMVSCETVGQVFSDMWNEAAIQAREQPAQEPSQQQPTQQPTQQPSQQQPAQPTWPPAANQPAPTGTWRTSAGTVLWIFNANGTGMQRPTTPNIPDTPFTWTASGNRLTVTWDNGGSTIYVYSKNGNSLFWLDVRVYDESRAPNPMTRQ